jgi:hypothetical protein
MELMKDIEIHGDNIKLHFEGKIYKPVDWVQDWFQCQCLVNTAMNYLVP